MEGVGRQNLARGRIPISAKFICMPFSPYLDEYEAANRDSINVRKPTEGAQWEQDAKDVVKVDATPNAAKGTGEHAKSLRSPPRSSDDIEQAAWRWIEGGFAEFMNRVVAKNQGI
ncbi:hypothetical protein CFAM422_009723 [Trichoderma lentiforme]|uniref:Uncharacterized protein n=1 Tax=Trichoderma lentiforme TaxID=1567552 RepID=A0A9P4X7N4_9HYPO|nr:hypothetical protein CFAM422_009723 [Trichoderma lentiforme]